MQQLTFKKKAPVLTDEQKRYLLANHEILPIEKLADLLGISVAQAITQCARMYCSYFRASDQ